MNVLQQIRDRFRPVLEPLVGDVRPYLDMVRPAQNPEFGDFQANCAMPLAKVLGKNPREIARDLVDRLQIDDLCEPPEVAGPGFVNLRLKDDWLLARANAMVADKRLGVPNVETPRKTIVDFSAPNVAKPMHVGHLRSTVIGDAICRILRFLGHDVVGDNHIGDWGTQFGMILYGYKHFRDQAAYEADPVGELARLYRLVNQLCDYHEARADLPAREEELAAARTALETAEAEAQPGDKSAKKALKKQRKDVESLAQSLDSLRSKVENVESDPVLQQLAEQHPDVVRLTRQETAKLHAGDEENLRLWNEFLPECLTALQRVYDRLGVRFDQTLGESHFQPLLGDVVESLQQAGIAAESDGALCVFNEGHDAPLIVRKRDGAYTYATTDLATIRHRVEHEAADEILYVVDSRQSEHFEQLFATAGRWGYDDVTFRHLKFGTVLGTDGRPYKTRSGDTVGLESLLDQAHTEARKIVDANDDAKPDGPELSAEERDRVAETVGIGGIKYADLNHNRESDYRFDWNKMLAKEGNTATYMQYAHARVFGIFRKGGTDPETVRAAAASIVLTDPAERALVLQLCRFTDALHDVVTDYRPNLLTQYLFDLANRFSTFFENCPVLKAETEEARASRLLLCDLTARVVRQGLELLGIQVCERM